MNYDFLKEAMKINEETTKYEPQQGEATMYRRHAFGDSLRDIPREEVNFDNPTDPLPDLIKEGYIPIGYVLPEIWKTSTGERCDRVYNMIYYLIPVEGGYKVACYNYAGNYESILAKNGKDWQDVDPRGFEYRSRQGVFTKRVGINRIKKTLERYHDDYGDDIGFF